MSSNLFDFNIIKGKVMRTPTLYAAAVLRAKGYDSINV